MRNEPSLHLPSNGRLISAGMAGAAAVNLLLNHVMIESQGITGLMILCLGPLAFFLGIGGIVDPKIVIQAFNADKTLNGTSRNALRHTAAH